MAIFETFDTVAQRRVALFDSPDMECAVREARKAARFFPQAFPNGPDALLTCAADPATLPPERVAAARRFGMYVIPTD